LNNKDGVRIVLLALLLMFLIGACSSSNPKPSSNGGTPVITADAPTLQQQRMCADQAKKAFDEVEKAMASVPPTVYKLIGADYTDHFDVSTSTCYVEVADSWTPDGQKTFCNAKSVYDAFERHVYATYS